MKNNKGITLIALVVTIIVLLILAGVSIAMLTGQNGILTNAQKARDNSAAGTLEEATKIAIGNIMTENLKWPYGKKNAAGTGYELDTDAAGADGATAKSAILAEIVKVNSNITIVDSGTKITDTKLTIEAKIDNQTKTQKVEVELTTGAVTAVK